MMVSNLLRRQEFAATLCLALLIAYFAAVLGGTWASDAPSLLRDVSWLGIVAIGQAMVMISGEFDLSVGSVYAFVSMVFVLLLQAGLGPLAAFALAMGLAICIGFLNGYLTWRFKLPSLLVTLGFLFVYRGLVEFVTGGKTLAIPSAIQQSDFIQLLGGKVFGLHLSIYVCLVLLAFVSFVMAKTQYGNHVYAVGGDVNAAAATGVPCGAVKIRTFIICSGLAGFTGIITAANLNSVSTTTGTAMEFEAIAATVISGVALLGGAGTIWGAVLGVVTLLALKHGLILDGVNIFSYQILLGIVLVGLVALKGLLPYAPAKT
jgi:ribose/xylose/arabinose/galactoside ABC-type transport system permease subunit